MLLEERGEVTSAEVAEACRFDQGTAKRWLNQFVELGLATRHFEGIKGQHGGRRVVYRRRKNPLQEKPAAEKLSLPQVSPVE